MDIKQPTVENLKVLYESEMYQNLLSKFIERSSLKLDNRESNSAVLYSKLVYCQRRYQLLNISFEELWEAFENNIDLFLTYQIIATDFFNQKDRTLEFGLMESDLINVNNIDKTYLLERFCEFHLLQSGNKERLICYLGRTKVMYIVKYAEQITKLYRQAIEKNATQNEVSENKENKKKHLAKLLYAEYMNCSNVKKANFKWNMVMFFED